MKIRLLVIDDDSNLTTKVENFFLNDKDICVTLKATDGDNGYYKIKNNEEDYDVVLLDLIMPKKDGIYVLEKMKEEKLNKTVIILSSFGEETVIKKVCEYGVKYFILKPFDLIEMKKIILEVWASKINRKHIIKSTTAHVDNISNILHQFGMPSNLKGYMYIREAIILILNDSYFDTLFLKRLYPKIASKFRTTVPNVERSIRHAIEISFIRGNLCLIEEFFGYSVSPEKAKPTNSEFIITIADKIKIEMFKLY